MSNVVRSQCPYCGVGCGIELTVNDGKVVRVTGDSAHPANQGKLCIKGATIEQMLTPDSRLTHAQIRSDRNAALQAVGLDQALDHAAQRLNAIRQHHGNEAIGFYLSGQLTNETSYLVTKLCKGLMGTNTMDANSRLCMASAVAAYTRTLGTDGPPCSYSDIEQADCFLIVGSNTAECHPIVYRRIEQQVRKHGAKLIVVDPRRTQTSRYASLHLAAAPGSDTALLNGLLHILIRDGAVDYEFIAQHTTGWSEIAEAVAGWTPAQTALATGLTVEEIETAGAMLVASQRTLSMWSMGVNQSRNGVAKATAIINMHLATGRIGKPGCGPFSLTGQPNAMGGREVGYLAHQLPGYRRVDIAEHRSAIEQAWGIPVGSISATPGPDAQTMFSQLAEGKLKAIWIIGTNPLHSMPNNSTIRAALEKAELVIVQDVYHTSSCLAYADIALPAAQWAESIGTFTASDRHITLLNPAYPAPGDAMPDWWLVQAVAQRMGFELNFANAEAIWDEYRGLTAGRYPLDVSGVSYERLRNGPLQWPCPAEDHAGTVRLYSDGRFATANGRANFQVTIPVEPAEVPSYEFPFWLTTGRVLEQWHTRTRTANVAKLNQRHNGSFIEIHPDDANTLGVSAGEKIAVIGRRGSCTSIVQINPEIMPGCLFMPIHWEDGNPNVLSINAADPISKQPELKACAVQLRPIVEGINIKFGEAATVPAMAAGKRSSQ